MKIGTKLFGSFIGIVVLFGAICVYMVFNFNYLSSLEEITEARTEDALKLKEAEAEVLGLYPVVADGIINRNIEQTHKDFDEVKKLLLVKVAEVKELVDTDAEVALAGEFESGLKSYFDIVEKGLFPILDKEESFQQRVEDALALKDVEVRVGEVYAVMADSVINRNLAASRKEFAQVKENATADIALVHEIVDTDEERAMAEEFETAYKQYLAIYETQMLPTLAAGGNVATVRAIDGKIDVARDAADRAVMDIVESLEKEAEEILADEVIIKELDGKIDGLRDLTIASLHEIAESLQEEQLEAAEMFDTTIQQVIVMAIIVGLVGVVIAIILAFIITRNITVPLKKVTEVSDQIARGDFTVENLKVKSKDEVGQLATSFGQMVEALKYKAEIIKTIAGGDLTADIEKASEVDGLGQSLIDMSLSLNDLLSQVNVAVEQVSGGADQVSQSGQSMSQGASEQASSLEEVTSSLNEINGQSKQNAEKSVEANAIAKTATEDAESGNAQMVELVGAMEKINESSNEIKKVVKVIDDIAFQINLLALNANVEAARAGKYGKGFAVVADEVRNLAVRSADAVKETTRMVEESTKNIEEGTVAAETTAKKLEEIVNGSSKVADFLDEIALASKEQAQGVEQINGGLEQIDSVTQENTANAEESASAAEELASQAQQLKALISRFRLKSNGSGNGHGAAAVATATAQLKTEHRPEPVKATRHHVVKDGNGTNPQPVAVAQSGAKDQPVDPKDVINLDDGNFGKF